MTITTCYEKKKDLETISKIIINPIPIVKVDIRKTEYASIAEALTQAFAQHPDLRAVFTTNSRVSSVAHFVESTSRADLQLIGYDFLANNITYLNNETINFLICQKPEEQAFRGIMALYQHLVLSAEVRRDALHAHQYYHEREL